MAIEYVGSATERARTRARRAARTHELSFLRRVDWLLTARGGGAHRLRALGDQRHHPPRRGGEPALLPRPAGDVRRRRSGRLPARARAESVAPGPLLASDLRGDGRRDGARVPRRPGDARLEAVARPRLVPLPAVRVREAALRPRAGRLSRRACETDQRAADGAQRCRPGGSARRSRLHAAGLRHGARLRRRARGRPLRRGDALADARRARLGRARRGRADPLGAARGGRTFCSRTR